MRIQSFPVRLNFIVQGIISIRKQDSYFIRGEIMGRLIRMLIRFAPIIYPAVRKFMKNRKRKKQNTQDTKRS